MICSDGPSNTVEIPAHKLIYEGAPGKVFLTPHLGRLWMHVEVTQPINAKRMRECWEVIDALDDALRLKGIKEYHTAVDTHERFRFAQSFGFHAINECIRDEWVDKDLFQIMVKDL